MNINLQEYIDDFRFLIVDENNKQRSSTWRIKGEGESVYVFVRTQAGKNKLSFHPIDKGEDGNDSQYGLSSGHRNELKNKGFIVPNRIRWKRPNNKEKINLCARILFPTDFLNGEVHQFIKEKKKKVSFPMAPSGFAVEVSVFFHYLDTKSVEDFLVKKSYTPIFFIKLASGEIAQITARNIPLNKILMPKSEDKKSYKLSNQEITDSKFIHGIMINDVKDHKPIELTEFNGFELKNNPDPST